MIRFDQVTKTYRGTQRPALDDITVEILKGEFVFLVGQSGSGKSSFLRLILKEDRATRGRIHVLGQNVGALSSRKVPYFRRNLGVVFQDFRLLANRNVYDNVAFALQVIGRSKGFIQEAVPDVLNLVGLAGKQHRLPHELSGGEQQRVAIARAVVNKPSILLADEPTGNLDPSTSAGIMALLSSINTNGTTVLMATHDATIVDQMQRRVIELVAGRIVRDEKSGGYETTAIPIQDAQEQLATEGTVPDEEAAAEQRQVAALVAKKTRAAEPVRVAKPAAAPAPAARPTASAPTPAASPPTPAASPPTPAASPPTPAAEAESPAELPPSAADQLADAVSRATQALPVVKRSEKSPLAEPEKRR